MSCHLQIVRLGGEFTLKLLNIVPENVPALSDMEAGHLFCENHSDFGLLLNCEVTMFKEVRVRRKVHEITSIDADVYSISQVYTLFIPPDCTAVFNVVDNQGSIMNDLT